MLPHFPPTPYKCIIPIEKPLTASSAIYHSPLDQPREPAQRLPFPAWPEIEEPYQPLCLPTLMRAVYFHHQSAFVEPEAVDTTTEKYLSRPEVIEREISEQVIAFAKSQQIFSQHSAELATLPQVTSDLCNDYIGLLRKLGNSVERAFEAFMQASIYGNFENFYGAKGAFAFAHESAHRDAILLHSGVVLDELSKLIHKTLSTLTTERLSRKQTAELWARFVQTNNQIVHLAQKFEPIEEIYATYIGMRFLPSEVRNIVEASVEQDLRANNWYTAYKSFVEACDNSQFLTPPAAASFIFDQVCRMLEQIDIDSAYLLYKFSEISKILWPYFKIKEQGNDINQDELAIVEMEATKKINIILEQAGIPNEVYWSGSTWSTSTTIDNIVDSRLRRLAEGKRLGNGMVSAREVIG